MADRQPNTPTHRAYSVIKREGRDDYWLNLGLVFPHKDGSGFNIILQALPLDGKIVCREVSEEDQSDAAPQQRSRQETPAGVKGGAVDEPRDASRQARKALRDRGLRG
jgi:hypothetical protein